MSKYTTHSFTLSDAQVKNLAACGKVRLKHSQLNGSQAIHLTKHQNQKLQKSIASNKGMDLQLKPEQVKHMVKSGGSIFSSILGLLGGLGVRKRGGDVTPQEYKNNYDSMTGAMKEYNDAVWRKNAKMIEGSGKGKKGKKGEGILEDIGAFLKPVGNTLLKEGLPILLKAVTGGAGAKGKGKGKGKAGGSFMLH